VLKQSRQAGNCNDENKKECEAMLHKFSNGGRGSTVGFRHSRSKSIAERFPPSFSHLKNCLLYTVKSTASIQTCHSTKFGHLPFDSWGAASL
jgi:hypothetical protein